MQQQLDISPDAGRPSGGGDASWNVQRASLRELVALASECGRDEQQIEQRHISDTSATEAELQRAEREVERKYADLRAEARQRHAQQLTDLDERLGEQIGEGRYAAETARKHIELESDTIEQDLKQQMQHSIWLAESLLEGTQNHARHAYQQTVEATSTELESLDAMAARAMELLDRYHQSPQPMPQDEPPESVALAAEEAGEAFAAQKNEMNQRLTQLQSLTAPQLFVGWRPYALVVAVCVLAALITQAVVGGLPPNGGMSGVAWRPVGIALGVGLGASLIFGLGLWMLARAKVRTNYLAILRAQARARTAAEVYIKAAADERRRRVAHAQHKRDQEVRAINEQLGPKLQKAIQQRTASLQASDADQALHRNQIEKERARASAEIDQGLRDNLESIERMHDEELRASRERHATKLRQSQRQHELDRAALQQRWSDGLQHIQAGIDGIRGGGNGDALNDWSDGAWERWSPPTAFASQVRFGQMRVDLRQIIDGLSGIELSKFKLPLPETFTVPALLAFPKQASMLIQTDAAGRDQALRTLQMAMARLLTSLPAGRVRFTIIDPVGLGQNFAGFMHLADHDEALVGTRIWTDAEHIDQRLRDLTEHMETVIQKYLRNEFETIDDYNAQAGELAEPYRFLVVADFPTNFSPESIRRLNSIASAGARCGVYTLVLRDTRQPLPGGSHLDELERFSVNLQRQGDRFVWKDEVLSRFPLTLDAPPDEQRLTQILEVVGRGAKEARRVELPFDSIAPTDDQFWSGDCTDELRIPIGRAGATRLQMLRLGRGVAQHGLIAGKTGSGKSTLLHVLITNLAMWYRPDEVEFYLVDFKKGVEFKTYATHVLPHARAIAVESDREFGLSVLHRVDAEMTRRGTLFREAGVQDLAAYRRQKGSGVRGQAPMPRLLLIIDEFQEFFSEDDKLGQDATLLLDRLVRQGRAFGIHVLLGSQTIGGSSGLARSTIGQMAVRIALQTTEADSQLILGDNNSAARLLSRPGEAIYNDAGGLIEGNSPFQVAWLPDERREEHLRRVQQRAKAASAQQSEPPIVFEGNVPADIRANRRLAALIDQPAERTQAAASAAKRIWLGEPVAIKEPTAVTLRRQSGSNVLLIGQQEDSALGIAAATLISLSAQHAPGSARFYLLDGTPADSPFAGALQRIGASLPHEVRNIEWRAVPDAINAVAQDVAKRQETSGHDAPAIYVLIYGLQRYRVLRKQEESFSFSSAADEESPQKPNPDKQFADILREGASLGVHVVAWADTLASIERTLDRGSMREFDHRVLFQMSANDSSNLIDSPAANRLGFYRALAYSEEQGVMEKFRPYALPDDEWLAEVKSRLVAG